MKAIETITGPVSVLMRDDVDTDQIIPKQFLKRVERTGFGEFLFYDWAKEAGWDLPVNQILVTGRNFGCGSSPRARAVGARGLRLPRRHRVVVRRHLQVQLHQDRPAARAADRRRVQGGRGGRQRAGRPLRPGGPLGGRRRLRTATFDIDPDIKHRLLEGLDDIALTLKQVAAIDVYEAERQRSGPDTKALSPA